jgi:hypothetical protein
MHLSHQIVRAEDIDVEPARYHAALAEYKEVMSGE